MIQIHLDESKDGKSGRLTVSGHAGADVRGRDVICSAVSAISQTLALYLCCLHETVAPFDTLIVTEGQNPFVVEYLVKDDGAVPRVQAAMDMAILGLGAIANQHPTYVQFINDPAGSA